MYKMKYITDDQDIKEFEEMREQVFFPAVPVHQYSFATAIKEGDMIAYQCLKNKKPIGGILIRLSGKNIKVSRIFVQEEERHQGAGTFMLQFIESNPEYFENYFGCKINGIVIEPLASSLDFYYDRGFDNSGTQLFKKFIKEKQM